MIIFLKNLKNILQLLQIYIFAVKSKNFQFFLKKKISVIKILNSSLILKVRNLSFKILDLIFLILIPNNSTFLYLFISQNLRYNFQHFSIRCYNYFKKYIR